MNIEKINNAKMAVAEYRDAKAAERLELENILSKWEKIMDDFPDRYYAYIGDYRGHSYYLEKDNNLWYISDDQEYNINHTKQSDLDFPLTVIKKFRKKIEATIANIPAEVANILNS